MNVTKDNKCKLDYQTMRVSRIDFPAWVCVCCWTAWNNYMSQCPRCTVIAGIEHFRTKERLLDIIGTKTSDEK